MTVIEGGQDEFVGVKDNFLLVSFFEQDFLTWKDPFYKLLFNALAIPFNKLSQFCFVIELEDFKSFWDRKIGVSLFGTFSDLDSDSLGNSVEERTEVVERTVFFQLEDSSIIS